MLSGRKIRQDGMRRLGNIALDCVEAKDTDAKGKRCIGQSLQGFSTLLTFMKLLP